jgi:GT2 family glycosyltransferase
LLPCATTGRAIANNLAATHATGELLIFLADDFEPSPGLVAAHAAYHRMNPDIDAAGIGPALFPDELRRDVFVRWQEDSGQIFGVPMRRAMAVWPRTFFYAANASIKKRKFDALRGFNEHFPYDAWEDYEFGLRWVASGGYSQFIAGATATHRHAVSFDERCAAMARAGASARVLESLHPNLNHAWRAMLRVNEARLTAPAEAAPTHLQMAFYAEQMEEAFRRGYLSGIAESAEAPN